MCFAEAQISLGPWGICITEILNSWEELESWPAELRGPGTVSSHLGPELLLRVPAGSRPLCGQVTCLTLHILGWKHMPLCLQQMGSPQDSQVALRS